MLIINASFRKYNNFFQFQFLVNKTVISQEDFPHLFKKLNIKPFKVK